MTIFGLRSLLFEEATSNDGGGGKAQEQQHAFDPEAFKKTFDLDINKRLDSLDKKHASQIKEIKTLMESLKPKQAEEQETAHQEQGKGQPDLEKIAMQKRVAALEKLVEEGNSKYERSEKAREETDRHSQIRTKLAAMKLADEAAINAGFKIFKDEVIRSEDGSLVAGQDAEPFDKYIERQVSTVYAFLLPAKQVNGAGAARNGSGQKAAIDLDDIKPGMTAEQRKLIQQEMSRVLASG